MSEDLDLATQLANHRRWLARMLFLPNEPERLAAETDASGQWLWWAGTSLDDRRERTVGGGGGDNNPVASAPVPVASDVAGSPVTAASPSPSRSPSSSPPPAVTLAASVAADYTDGNNSDNNNNNVDDDDDDYDNDNDSNAVPADPVAPAAETLRQIPDELFALALVINDLPAARGSSFPSRNRLRHEPGLAGEVNKKTGRLCLERRGGRLRAYAWDERLFTAAMWSFLLGEEGEGDNE